MKVSSLFCIVCLIAFHEFVGASTDWGLQTQIETAQSLTGDGLQMLELDLQPEFDINAENGASWHGLFRIRYDDRYRLDNNTSWQDGYSNLSKSALWGDSGEIELRELFLSMNLGDAYLTLGKQQIVWGKADGLKLLDVVDPQSFRKFILDEYEESRIPLWAANLEIPFDDNTLQIIWISDTTVHEPAVPGSAYTFTSRRFIPQVPTGVRVVEHDAELPATSLNDTDFGIRWSGYRSGWDYSLNYLYQYHDMPVLATRLEVMPTGPVVHVEPRYERTHIVGATASKAFSDMTFRLESAYSTNRFFLSTTQTDVDGLESANELAYVLGADWYGFSDTLLSIQVFDSHLVGLSGPATRPKHDRTLTFLARRTYLNESLELRLNWFANRKDNDGLVRLKMTYDWTDNLSVWTGLDVFYGDEQGIFGQFDQNDRFFIGVETQM
jgi:hypothetical protein